MRDRLFDAVRSVIREFVMPLVSPRGIYEYAVFSQSGNGYDLQPTDLTLGLPPLPDVVFKPGIPGLTSSLQTGTLVYVSFVNADQSKPFILAVAGPQDAPFVPSTMTLDSTGRIHVGGTETADPATFGRFLRSGDSVTIGTGSAPTGATGTIVFGPIITTMSKAGS